MKKAIIAGVLSALVSGSAFAAIDGWDGSWGAAGPDGATPGTPENALGGGAIDRASAELVFKGGLPLVSAGDYVTITGLGGAIIENGELEVKADGSFATLKAVTTEVHKYNALAKETGPLLADTDATKVSWSLATAPVLSAISSDITGAIPVMRMEGEEVTVAPGTVIKEGSPSEFATVSWGVANDAPMATVVPGDQFTVTTQVDVAVEF